MHLIRQPRSDELELLLDLVADAFPDNTAHRAEVRAGVVADPDYAAERAVVAVDGDDRPLAVAFAKETEVCLAGRRLPVGRIGTVCTSPTARRQGLGRGVVEGAARRLAHLGAVLLDPAPEAYVHRFYQGLGFVPAVRERSLVCCTRERLADRRPAGTLRPGTPDDLAAVNRLYEQHYLMQPGAYARRDEWWQGRLTGRPLLWTASVPRLHTAERNGSVVAYMIATDDDDHRVWELAGDGSAALDLLADEARRAGPQFNYCLTPDDPLRPALAAFEPEELAADPGPVMMRMANSDLLRPFLAEYLAAGGATLGDDASVTCAGGHLRATWSHLLALVYNGAPLEDWIDAGLLELTPDSSETRAALATLFPHRPAVRRPTDAF